MTNVIANLCKYVLYNSLKEYVKTHHSINRGVKPTAIEIIGRNTNSTLIHVSYNNNTRVYTYSCENGKYPEFDRLVDKWLKKS